jgi:His/Glu/Gln/Arg/opine family amino acid ABC transporter permease subunit
MVSFFVDVIPTYLPLLLSGALVTLELSIISMVVAIACGTLVALGRLSSSRFLRYALAAYVEIMRNIPLVVQLLVLYFTLPQIGIRLPAFIAGVVGLSLNLTAYLSEVFRAAILSIARGQREAGISIGMSPLQLHTRIILPQALLVAVPTLGGYFISLLKDCALVSFISVNELLRQGTIIINATFKSMEIYLLVAAIYFVMSFTAARAAQCVEWWITPRYLRGRGSR